LTTAGTQQLGALALTCLALTGSPVLASPVTEAWVGPPGDAVAASALSGWYASAATATDTIEFRDIRGALQNSFDRAFLQSRLPWMTLDASGDGPSALAFSDSGRLAFVLVHDDQTPGDAILRIDTDTWDVTTFAMAEFSDDTSGDANTALAFYEGTLIAAGDPGELRVYRAMRNDTTGVLIRTRPTGLPVSALAVDRDSERLFVASVGLVLQTNAPDATDAFGTAAVLGNVRALAHSPAFGFTFPTAGGKGLYALDADGDVHWISSGTSLVYTSLPGATDLSATACGRLLVANPSGNAWLSESLDGRLDFESWVLDEFDQVVTYAKGLISPDGEPSGWVIDADVITGGTRFHPATPDAACWALLLLMVNEELNADPAAKGLITQIMRRYAGLEPGGQPGWSADGMIRHWCDPFSATGNEKPGWPDEWATFSTMKMILGASRVVQRYPNDPDIREAASAILNQTDPVQTFDEYVRPTTHYVPLVSLGSSPNLSVLNRPYSEAILFVDQAADLGTSSQVGYDAWFNRSTSPSASYLVGRPVSVSSSNNFQAAFLTLYPMLTIQEYRDDPAWQDQVRDLLASHAAWTDDHAPRWFTVFSAGTTKPIWGGYNADSLTNHPGDVSTFTNLMAFAGARNGGRTDPAVAAYHAYRRGARQGWESGASMLYRRSNVDTTYSPNTAGLPDVGIGALGLAELIRPGVIEDVLTGDYAYITACPADMNGDGIVDNADIGAFVSLFLAQDPGADFTGDGIIDNADIGAFVAAFLSGC